MSPCYMNIINGLEVGFGEGLFADLGAQLGGLGLAGWDDCLSVPPSEPIYPPDNLRSRP